ncbi:Flp family type IVb pilin [Allohahella sp. A8]|uniref:Flp family type IVb pilin n=1 Tax=Allohahella sp. A8 TaxID=3141461 RepID=UPI003A8116E5
MAHSSPTNAIKKPNLPKKILGQGMTEYIIIVALIAVAAIGVYGLFGSAVRNQVASMASEMGGTEGAAATAAATAAGTSAVTLAEENKDANLSNYNAAGNAGIQSTGGGE